MHLIGHGLRDSEFFCSLSHNPLLQFPHTTLQKLKFGWTSELKIVKRVECGTKCFILFIAPIPAAIVFESFLTWVSQEKFSSINNPRDLATGSFLIGAPFIVGDGIWGKWFCFSFDVISIYSVLLISTVKLIALSQVLTHLTPDAIALSSSFMSSFVNVKLQSVTLELGSIEGKTLTCCARPPFPCPFQCWPRTWTIPPINHYKTTLEERKTGIRAVWPKLSVLDCR